MLLDVSIEFPNIGLVFKDLPNGFTIFGYRIAFYGVIIMIGAILGMLIAFHEAKITGQNVEHYVDLAIYGLVFAIIGARIYYVIFEWDYYSAHPSQIINIRNGGLAIYGGVLTALAVCFVLSKIHKIPFLKMADTGILGLITGQIVGRWGNFFNREAFGGDTDSLFAMRINVDDGIVKVNVPAGVTVTDGFIQVQPTFLYESFLNLVVLTLMLIFRKKKKFHGEVLAWYLGGYGIVRMIVEPMRTDQLLIPGTSIPVSFVLSAILVVVAVCIVVVGRVKCRGKETPVFYPEIPKVNKKEMKEREAAALEALKKTESSSSNEANTYYEKMMKEKE